MEAALRDRPEPQLEGATIEAAVLACLHESDVLLVKRAAHPLDPWSGHVSLPGGRHEPGDDGLRATALRETREEVGFDPLAVGRLLGALGTYLGRGRRVSGVRIAVYVASLHERPPLHLSDEVEAAHWVPLSQLEPTSSAVAEVPDPMPAYVLDMAGTPLVVWGITFGILEQLRALA